MFCLLCSSLYVYINILSYCSRLLVGWQRDIHEFDLEPRQCYVRSTKTLTKPFTCWSKGYSCNFTPSVPFVFLSEMRKTNRALGLWRCYSWCCLFILSWPINCFPYLWLRQRAHTAPVGPSTASWYLTSHCTYWNTEIPTGLSVYAK